MPMAAGQYAVAATQGWPARVIRWATRSSVNHAILCVDDDGSCVEAKPKGVCRTTAAAYPGAIWSNEALSPANVEAIAAYGIAHLGARYGWLTIAAITLELAHIHPRWLLRLLRSPGSLICSELVGHAYAAAGINLDPDEDPDRIRPDELLAAMTVTPSFTQS